MGGGLGVRTGVEGGEGVDNGWYQGFPSYLISLKWFGEEKQRYTSEKNKVTQWKVLK